MPQKWKIITVVQMNSWNVKYIFHKIFGIKFSTEFMGNNIPVEFGLQLVNEFTQRKIRRIQSWKAAHLPTLEIRVEQKGNRVKKERNMEGKRKKKIHAASAGNRTQDPSITDQMSVLTDQVHLKIQFRHRFDQNCPFTPSVHRLGSRFTRTSSVPLEKKKKEN